MTGGGGGVNQFNGVSTSSSAKIEATNIFKSRRLAGVEKFYAVMIALIDVKSIRTPTDWTAHVIFVYRFTLRTVQGRTFYLRARYGTIHMTGAVLKYIKCSKTYSSVLKQLPNEDKELSEVCILK